ncbi:MAG TPA: hypothetical protein VMT64_15725 [Candidatus Binataceae bacterium]|nr:hypothetical protein [Candidatus Binataceae bacterium]
MRVAATSIFVLALASLAIAASSMPPNEFDDIALGATLHELKARYPEASRNPDSDRHFQVYQVPALHGAEVKSPGAFQIYQGKVVGGQILLDSHNAQHWLDAMKARYGQPDSCTYCYDAEMATAVWHWDNGTSLKIEGEMLTELTREGAAQRSAWLARGESGKQLADNGDETTDEAGDAAAPVASSHKHRHLEGHEAPTTSSSSSQHQTTASGWRGYYDNLNSRLEHWLGWK